MLHSNHPNHGWVEFLGTITGTSSAENWSTRGARCGDSDDPMHVNTRRTSADHHHCAHRAGASAQVQTVSFSLESRQAGRGFNKPPLPCFLFGSATRHPTTAMILFAEDQRALLPSMPSSWRITTKALSNNLSRAMCAAISRNPVRQATSVTVEELSSIFGLARTRKLAALRRRRRRQNVLGATNGFACGLIR